MLPSLLRPPPRRVSTRAVGLSLALAYENGAVVVLGAAPAADLGFAALLERSVG